MFAPLRPLALAIAALALQCSLAHAAPEAATPVQGVYVGTLGDGQAVLVSLHADGQSLAGGYHHEQGWAQDDMQLAGSAIGARITLTETTAGPRGKLMHTGSFEGKASADGAGITGTWKGADGRSLPFALTRAAAWTAQAVAADGGIRSCERPRFSEERYAPVNRELADACDFFLADGHAGPGNLRLEIDSLGQYMVAAVGYATSGGRELPPETVTVDLGAEQGLAAAQASQAQPHVMAIASRP